VKAGWSLLLCSSLLLAQGWGRREAMRPWLQGKFPEAEATFFQKRADLPNFAQALLWESEFETERARFEQASALINEAKKIETTDSEGLPERRLARLLLSVGRFSEAQKTALSGRRWDGDVRTLKLTSAMDLVTIGEVYLAKGRYSEAITILGKGRDAAKNTSTLDGLEWVRAQNYIALADLNLGQLQAASQVAHLTLSAAEHEWGAPDIPAMDALDIIGLIKIAENDLSNADGSLTQSRRWREALYGARHPKVAASYMHAALLSAAQGNGMEAVRLTSQAMEIQKSLAVGGPNGMWGLALLSGAEVLASVGQNNDARECYQSALPILEQELGSDAPRVVDAHKSYAKLPEK
jgi:tetratricopeptide (TPR) repeat protein